MRCTIGGLALVLTAALLPLVDSDRYQSASASGWAKSHEIIRRVQPKKGGDAQLFEVAWNKASTWSKKLASEPPPQSPYKDYPDLSEWGWSYNGGHGAKNFDRSDVEVAFVKLHISSKHDDLVRYEWDHTCWGAGPHGQVRTIGGETYHATGAQYGQAFSAESGAIVVYHMLNPEEALEEKEQGTLPPKLESWGDVAFLAWDEWCSRKEKKGSSLEWIFFTDVREKETLAIMKHVLGNDWKNVRSYPGKIFLPSSPERQALLGSPTGQHAALMLAQHDQAFAGRAVDAVHVFSPVRKYSGTTWLNRRWPVLACHIGETAYRSAPSMNIEA